MENLSKNYKCQKCENQIPLINKTLHDATCVECPKFDDKYNEVLEVKKRDSRGKPKICPYCDKSWDNSEEFLDHVLKHESEFNTLGSRSNMALNASSNQNNDFQYPEKTEVVQAKPNNDLPSYDDICDPSTDFELIDKEKVEKEMKEERESEEKLKKKLGRSDNHNSENNGGIFQTIKNAACYLVDTKNGMRMAPIERLIRSIFIDRSEFIDFALEEVVTRAVEEVIINGDPVFQDPVDEATIEMIDTITIKNVKELTQDKKDCVICLEEYVEGDICINLPCFHLFHKQCIKDWLLKNGSCPICKHVMKKDEIN